MFEQRGVAVYIADDRAKELMCSDENLKGKIAATFGSQCYNGGVLNRQYLAQQIFSDDSKRLALNAIVHPAVCHDFCRWAENQCGEYVIVESAILFESGLSDVVDYTVAVVVEQSVAIERAMARDGANREAIVARMAVQKGADELKAMSDYTIDNTTLESAEIQVAEVDRALRDEIS
jgi:dephospho-CoA kinase